MEEYPFPRWVYIPWPAFLAINGITLAPWLVVSRYTFEDARFSLWAHEWRHTQQMRDLGYLHFLARYLYEVVRYGYRRSPLEVDAREFARDVGGYVFDWGDARAAKGLPR